MKFIYLIMGPFDSKIDRKAIGKNKNAEIIGVKNLEEAKEISKSLVGYADLIELCGAFGKDGAKEIKKLLLIKYLLVLLGIWNVKMTCLMKLLSRIDNILVI